MSPKAVLAALKTKKDGLTEKEATSRLGTYGPNALPKRKQASSWMLFLDQFTDPLVLILIGAAIISFFVGERFDALLILLIVIFNAIFGFFQEYKAERSLEALEKLLTPSAVVVRNGSKHTISSLELVPGDIVVLAEGDSIAADMRLIEVYDLQVSEALLTGESAPISKMTLGVNSGALVTAQKNMAFSGTLVTRGSATGVVIATGLITELGKISKMLETVVIEQTPLQKRLEHFGKLLGKGILLLCGVIFVTEMLDGLRVIDAFLESLSLAVAAIPEGLPAVVTIALATGIFRMMQQKALVRRLPAVEALGSCTAICSDKTGTLTKNEMTVVQLSVDDVVVHLTAAGFTEKGNHPDIELLLRIGALCNDATIANGEMIGDPTEVALLVSATKGGLGTKKLAHDYKRTNVVSFTSTRAMMTTVHQTKHGTEAYTKGSVDAVLAKCSRYVGNGKVMPLTKNIKAKVVQHENTMASHALRVLAFAYKPMTSKIIENDLIFVGLQGMMDPPREGVKEAIALCKQAGIKVVMITGDNKTTATAIANDLDMAGEAVSGEELEAMSDKELRKHAGHVTVYARATPHHKIRIVSALQAIGHIVAMTGDGVNDAPALKKADIGIAMGMRGTEVAKQASGIVLTDDNFSTIVNAVQEGRRIYDNIKKFIDTLLSCNFGEVVLVFVASLTRLPLPVTAVQLLWINLVTDGLPALAVAVDPASPGVMQRPPRSPHEALLPKPLLLELIVVGLIIGLGTLAVFVIDLPNGLRHAQTMAFTGIILGEFVRLFMVRREYATPLFVNMWLLMAVGAAVLLQYLLLYTSLSTYFKLIALTTSDWIILFVLVVGIVLGSLAARIVIKKMVQ